MNRNVQFDTGSAILQALDYFDWHVAFAISFAAAMAVVGLRQAPAPGLPVPVGKRLLNEFIRNVPFSLFGLTTAYFLSLGINPEEGPHDNSLFAQFAPPLIALITGGVTYLVGKTQEGLDRTVVGMTTFLGVTAISYYAFSLQIRG